MCIFPEIKLTNSQKNNVGDNDDVVDNYYVYKIQYLVKATRQVFIGKKKKILL